MVEFALATDGYGASDEEAAEDAAAVERMTEETAAAETMVCVVEAIVWVRV